MMAGAAILAFTATGGSLFLRVPAALAAAIAVAVWRASCSNAPALGSTAGPLQRLKAKAYVLPSEGSFRAVYAPL